MFRLAAAAAIAALLLAQPAAGSTVPLDNSEQGLDSAPVEHLVNDLEAIEVHLDGGTLDIDAARTDSNVDNEVLTEYAVGIALADGELLGESTAVESHAAKIDAAFESATDESFATTCNGSNGFATFYPRAFLDSCQASALSAMLGTGAGVASIAGLIMAVTGAPAAVAGAIAAYLAVYSALTSLCNSWNTGIVLTAPPMGPIFCYAQ